MREVNVWYNYRGEKIAEARDIGDIYINTKLRWWVAEITGVDPRWGFAREFLPKRRFDFSSRRTSCVVVDGLTVGVLLEVAGGGWTNSYRAYVLVTSPPILSDTEGVMTVEEITAGEARRRAEAMGIVFTPQFLPDL